MTLIYVYYLTIPSDILLKHHLAVTASYSTAFCHFPRNESYLPVRGSTPAYLYNICLYMCFYETFMQEIYLNSILY